MADDPDRKDRRDFITGGLRAIGLLAAGGTVGALAARDDTDDQLWQIDPDKCIGCGRCATECVLTPSAVKCVHEWPRCGYCELCFGYYIDQRVDDRETAENQRCPVNAISRALVEDPYFEYVIDETKCIGCGLCVKGCNDYGNGALILQVRHDRCVNCNECAIAAVCPADAFQRVPRDKPYLLRTVPDEDAPTGEPPRPADQPQPPAPAPKPADTIPDNTPAGDLADPLNVRGVGDI
jgi:electron transport complex protein RnfB